MKFNLTYFKLPALIQQQSKNEAELEKKTIKPTPLKPTLQSQSTYKVLYDSDWADVPPEDIASAVTQVEEMELPQKVPYEYSLDLAIPEIFLPFIDIALLTKPVDQQKVKGVGQFVYSSLREVQITLYNWMGVTEFIQGLGQVGGFVTIPIASPHASLPSFSATIPPPQECYGSSVYYVNVEADQIGTGVGPYPTNPTGTFLPTINQTLAQWTQSLVDTYSTTFTSILFDVAQEYHFLHPYLNFPVPDGSFLPCGGEVSPDPTNYPNQRWEAQTIQSFQGYMSVTGSTYAQAVAVFTQYYPEIFITPEAMGPPYKAYRRVISDVVESGTQKIKITKNAEENFTFSVYGDLLLISPAITETDYSDPIFPTFKPDSPPLAMRLKITFREHPVNFITTRYYKK